MLTPVGGTGMNTAIHDVHNLAWKLAAVLQGWAGPRLLDTYEEERLPVGSRNVRWSLLGWQAVFGGGGPGSGQDGQLTSRQVDLGYVYASGAVVSDGSPEPQPSPNYIADARPGARAPHAWIQLDGRRVSTIDLFDRDFVLLAGARGRAWLEAAERTGHQLGMRLAVHTVSEPDWAEAYAGGWGRAGST